MKGNVWWVVWVALAFLSGVAVGGAGPRGEARALREEVARLEREAEGFGGSAIARIMADRLGRAPTGPSAAPSDRDGEDLADALARAQDEEPGVEPAALEATGPKPAIPEEEAEKIREMMLLRAAQARTALQQEMEPDEAQQRALDASIDHMNDTLVDLAYAMQEQLRTDVPFDRPATMRVGSEILATLAEAEESLRAAMTPEQRERIPPEVTDPIGFIDPAVLDVIAEMDPTMLRGGSR